MFDPALYDYDRSNSSHEATLRDGAILYRLASIHFCGKGDILRGAGPLKTRISGRFNVAQQQVTYCSNNVLVCIGEVLYHMYRQVLNGIAMRASYHEVCSGMLWTKCLAIVRVEEIDGLVYLDSRGVSLDYDPRISGTTVVFPDQIYEPFMDLNERVRSEGKRGIVYPSARHSMDLCIALFDDETSRLSSNYYELLEVDLQLVPEDQDPGSAPANCDPFSVKLHPTMGYYRFRDTTEFQRVASTGALNPVIPISGMVDFVRRSYSKYPSDAVRR